MQGKAKIEIQGHLDKKWQDWFNGFHFIYENGNTILLGNLKDEAFMHGILNLIRNLNLTLVSLNPASDNNPKNVTNN